MASETKRALIRVGSNYARMALLLVISLVSVPLLLRVLTNDGYGLFGAFMSMTLLCTLPQQVLDSCAVRPLGAALPRGGKWFAEIYNSMALISLAAAVLMLLPFAALYLCLPWIQMPQGAMLGAQWFVATRALQFFVQALLTPQINMYLVSERMILFNIWSVLNRFSYLAGALAILPFDHAGLCRGLIILSAVSAGFCIATMLILAGWIMWVDPRLRLSPRAATRAGVKEILKISGWNIPVIGSINLHERVDQILLNQWFGPAANTIFTAATQLSVAVRMMIGGMTTGVEAVSARLSSTQQHQSMRRLIFHSTRLHAWAAVAGLTVVCVLADPIIRIWLGSGLERPQQMVPLIVRMAQILAIGWAAKAVSDNWTLILYGAGHIHRYSIWLLVGGIAHPVLAVALLYLLPLESAYMAPAWAFVVTLLAVNMGVVAVITSRCLQLTLSDILQPLLRPTIVGLICAAALIAVRLAVTFNLRVLLAVVVGYSVLYVLLTWLLVLSASERQRTLSRLLALVRSSRFLPPKTDVLA